MVHVVVFAQPSLMTFPVEQRQAVLARVWGFACTCARCGQPNESDRHLESATAALDEAAMDALQTEYAELDAFVTQCEAAPEEAAKPAADALVKRCVAFLAAPPLAFTHWLKHELRRQLVPVLLERRARDGLHEAVRQLQLHCRALREVSLCSFWGVLKIGVGVSQQRVVLAPVAKERCFPRARY